MAQVRGMRSTGTVGNPDQPLVTMSYQWWSLLSESECGWMNQEFPIWHLAMNEHLNKLLLLFNEAESLLSRFSNALMTTGYRSRSIKRRWECGTMSSSITHGCIFKLGHFRPGRTERPVPPSGGPRERCPALSADRRRPVRFVEEHRAGWFQFLRTRLRHRVTGA